MTENTPKQRIFKIGSTKIVADESMRDLSNEAVRDLLKRTYPEVANATIREQELEDGTTLTEWIPAPGRKG
jgi:PRTRC genetic system protein C